jgi:ABC-type antimicrobial peptide transport system ATPase subunit
MSLKEFKADKQYLNEHYEALKSEHPDEFVVIHKGQVIASGVALEEVLSDARKEIGEKLNDSVVEYLSTRKVEMVV